MDNMNIDGIDQWQTISSGYPTPRETLVVDINEKRDTYAVVTNNYKYIKGPSVLRSCPELNTFSNLYTITSTQQPKYDIKELSKSSAWQALQRNLRDPCILDKITTPCQDVNSVNFIHKFNEVINFTEKSCSFNLETDICEQNFDLANMYSYINLIQEWMKKYEMSPAPEIFPHARPISNSELLSFYLTRSPKQLKYSKEQISTSPTWQVLQMYSEHKTVLDKVTRLRQDATVNCTHDVDNVMNCTDEPCLFDLKTDPCEQFNIASTHLDIVSYVEKLIDKYKENDVPNMIFNADPASNPGNFNGTWSIWVD